MVSIIPVFSTNDSPVWNSCVWFEVVKVFASKLLKSKFWLAASVVFCSVVVKAVASNPILVSILLSIFVFVSTNGEESGIVPVIPSSGSIDWCKISFIFCKFDVVSVVWYSPKSNPVFWSVIGVDVVKFSVLMREFTSDDW